MSCNVLGVYLGHDLGACLLQDGKITAMIEEERLNRYKHGRPNSLAGLWPQFGGKFGYFPWASVAYCLSAAGLGLDDVDLIAVGDRIWGSGAAETIADVIPIKDKSKVVFVDTPKDAAHHFHHALSAFYASSFEDAAVLVVDGDGNSGPEGYEAESGYSFAGRLGKHELVFKNRYTSPHVPRSGIGWTYEHVTMLLGFCDPDIFLADAGKTMGLAAYGGPNPELAEPWIKVDGFKLDYSGFQDWLEGHGYAEQLTERRFKLARGKHGIDQFAKDLAYKVQVELEDAMLALVGELHRATGSDRLCIAGGVGLNSVANGRIVREAKFKDVFIQPASHDGGQAIGLAYHAHLLLQKKRGGPGVAIKPQRHAYLGRCYAEHEIETLLEKTGLPFERLRNDDELTAAAAEDLAAGNIIGWLQGGSEVGPRALGHRSILAHPGLPDMKDRLNARVKFREGFRPFAPSVLRERVQDLFEFDGDAPYMLVVAPVREAWRERLPAITHVDGTARIQTVERDVEPLYHALISAFEKRTGLPVITNTSFNLRGMPIVETPFDALTCFLFTAMDRLYLGRYRISPAGAESFVPFWNKGWKAQIARPSAKARPEAVVQTVSGAKRHSIAIDEAMAGIVLGIDGVRTLAKICESQGDTLPRLQALRVTQELMRTGALGMRIGALTLADDRDELHWWQLPRAVVLQNLT